MPGLVGIYFAPKKVTLALVKHKKGKPCITACVELPAESAEDRARVLENEVKKLSLENYRACFVLSPTDYKLLLVEAPNVEPAEMAGAMKWKIKDLIDGAVDEMAITSFPVPDDAYRSQSNMVYAVAARKSKVMEIADLVNRTGLVLDVIDIPELVLMNLSAACTDDTHGLAFMDLRGSGSTMNLCREGAIYLTRHLNTPMDHDVMNTLDWDSVREKLVLEIQRSLDYYESQMGQTTISRIVLAPRRNDSEALALQLDNAMAVKVECMDMNESIDSEVELPVSLQQSCLMAIGGALRQEQAA